ncbi:MAG: hypothetical protein RRB13_12315 [bacterium]|nr:hypothetical protein [bacterium]
MRPLALVLIFVGWSLSASAGGWAQNRSERQYFAALGVDAWVSMERDSRPLYLGAFWGPDWLAGIKYAQEPDYRRSGVRYDLDEAGVWGRWFWGETTNLKAGLSRMQGQWNESLGSAAYQAQAEAWRVSLGAGNQWHFGARWVISLDWAVYNHRLNFTQSYQAASQNAAINNQVASQADELRNLWGYPGLAELSFGYSF